MNPRFFVLLYDKTQEAIVRESIIPALQPRLTAYYTFINEQALQYGLASVAEERIVITYLSDEQLRDFIPYAVERHWKLGLLPHPDMFHLKNGFGIASALEVAIENVLTAKSAQKVDMLLANGRPAFDTLVIGNCLSLIWGSTESTKSGRMFGRISSFFKLFKQLRLKEYTFRFGSKEKQPIATAALGVLVVQHGRSSLLSRKILEDTYANDGQMNVLILSPESVLGLIKFGILSILRSKRAKYLPPFAAYVKTDYIHISSPEAIEFSVDDVLLSAREIELTIIRKNVEIVPGVNLQTQVEGTNAEVFKTHHLPRGQQKEELLRGPLPLIPHASSEQFKELFTVLRQNSLPRSSYLVLMCLSAIIATLGLFSNSSPVIIGAMILAPLMAPIVSLAMGVLRQENKLIRNSLISIVLGLLMGYLCSVLLTWLLPDFSANQQILSRTKPNLLDLGIAIASGIAGAYAHAKKEIAQTLAGVAIAVALVPPLAVSGIGVGWLNWPVFSGALLLLMTNLVGIVLAAALTFLFLGFSPFRLAKKGLLISTALVIGIIIPLVFSFTRMLREERIIQQLNGYQVNHMVIRDVSVRQMQPLSLAITVFAPRPLGNLELQKIKQEVEARFGQPVALEITTGVKLE